LKSCSDLPDHYDDKRDKIVLHITTPDLQDQDQDRSVQDRDDSMQNQDQDQDRLFWSQTGLDLRPTVSDHITGIVWYSLTICAFCIFLCTRH